MWEADPIDLPMYIPIPINYKIRFVISNKADNNMIYWICHNSSKLQTQFVSVIEWDIRSICYKIEKWFYRIQTIYWG